MKVVSAILLSVCFVAVLLIVYVIHVWYFPVNVVFYSALGDAALAVTVMALIMFGLGSRTLGSFEKVQLFVIWLLCGYAFAISVPTVLDRSLSFYILEKLQQRGGGIERAQLSDVFTKEYMPEFRLIDVRLTEQIESGTIKIEDGCVKLTKRGRQLATFSRYFRTHFLPKQRLLAGQYTNVLVDPFSQSTTGRMGYECK